MKQLRVSRVFNARTGELISSAGRNAFIAAFFEGDTTAFDHVCVALARDPHKI